MFNYKPVKSLFKEYGLSPQILSDVLVVAVTGWPGKSVECITAEYSPLVKKLNTLDALEETGFAFLAGGAYCLIAVLK